MENGETTLNDYKDFLKNEKYKEWSTMIYCHAFFNPIPHGFFFDPLYHESVCCTYRTRTRFTIIHDFVPLGICQDLVKLLLTFFPKRIEVLDDKIFWGSLSVRKKFLKNRFFF